MRSAAMRQAPCHTQAGAARRGTPTRTRRAPCRRAGSGHRPRSSSRWPRTAFWGRVALQQLGRPAVHRNLGLELADSLLRSSQLSSLAAAEPGFDAAVDAVLSPPVVDRLITDPEVRGDVSDTPPSLDQVQHSPTELRRITPSSHGVLLEDNSHRIQELDSPKRGRTTTELRTSTGPPCEKRCTKALARTATPRSSPLLALRREKLSRTSTSTSCPRSCRSHYRRSTLTTSPQWPRDSNDSIVAESSSTRQAR